MRMLVTVEMDTEKTNEAARNGTLGQTIQAILEEQKPAAAYFVAHNGKRTGVLIVDLQENSDIPALAEPWFLAFGAAVVATPAMVIEDLAKASPAIAAAAEKYG